MLRGSKKDIDYVRDETVARSIAIHELDEVKKPESMIGISKAEYMHPIEATAQLNKLGCDKVILPKVIFPVSSITRGEEGSFGTQLCLLATENNADFLDDTLDKMRRTDFELSKMALLVQNGQEGKTKHLETMQASYKKGLETIFEGQKQFLYEAADVVAAIKKGNFDFSMLRIIK